MQLTNSLKNTQFARALHLNTGKDAGGLGQWCAFNQRFVEARKGAIRLDQLVQDLTRALGHQGLGEDGRMTDHVHQNMQDRIHPRVICGIF